MLAYLGAIELPSRASAEVREELRKLIGYFENNRHRTDYPSYRQKGWDIGSGPTEAGCKIIGERLKGSGMRWVKDGAATVAAISGTASGPNPIIPPHEVTQVKDAHPAFFSEDSSVALALVLGLGRRRVGLHRPADHAVDPAADGLDLVQEQVARVDEHVELGCGCRGRTGWVGCQCHGEFPEELASRAVRQNCPTVFFPRMGATDVPPWARKQEEPKPEKPKRSRKKAS